MKRIVLLAVILMTCVLQSCKKKPVLSRDTKKLNKVWIWNGEYRASGGSVKYIFFSDTSMPVIVHDKKRITFLDHSMEYLDERLFYSGHFIEVDESNYITFARTYSSGSSEVAYLRYYYKNDSVAFFEGWGSPGAGGSYSWYTK